MEGFLCDSRSFGSAVLVVNVVGVAVDRLVEFRLSLLRQLLHCAPILFPEQREWQRSRQVGHVLVGGVGPSPATYSTYLCFRGGIYRGNDAHALVAKICRHFCVLFL